MKQNASKLNLFLAHRRSLIDYATPIVGDRADAEDVVQEAWLRFEDMLARPGAAPDTIRQPAGYLYRIVRNLAVDWARKLATERRHHQASGTLDQLADQPDRISPEATALHRDTLRRVAAAVTQLPERNRIAFEMHRFGGHTFQEIADHLGISLGHAHGLVRDAVSYCAAQSRNPTGGKKT